MSHKGLPVKDIIKNADHANDRLPCYRGSPARGSFSFVVFAVWSAGGSGTWDNGYPSIMMPCVVDVMGSGRDERFFLQKSLAFIRSIRILGKIMENRCTIRLIHIDGPIGLGTLILRR